VLTPFVDNDFYADWHILLMISQVVYDFINWAYSKVGTIFEIGADSVLSVYLF
jgi:hypothetical protein